MHRVWSKSGARRRRARNGVTVCSRISAQFGSVRRRPASVRDGLVMPSSWPLPDDWPPVKCSPGQRDRGVGSVWVGDGERFGQASGLRHALCRAGRPAARDRSGPVWFSGVRRFWGGAAAVVPCGGSCGPALGLRRCAQVRVSNLASANLNLQVDGRSFAVDAAHSNLRRDGSRKEQPTCDGSVPGEDCGLAAPCRRFEPPAGFATDGNGRHLRRCCRHPCN